MSAAKIMLGEIAVWFLFFIFYMMWASGPPPLIRSIFALFLVLYPILAVLLLLSPVILTTEIVISDKSVYSSAGSSRLSFEK